MSNELMIDNYFDSALRSVQQAKEFYCKKYFDGETNDDAVDFDWVCLQFNDALTCLERLHNIATEGVGND